MTLVLLGPPGAGKGTQAVSLAESLGYVHLSTGDVFRRHLAECTPLGEAAQSYMERGELVPDDIVIGMVRERLAQPDAAPGVVLDGFPRTVAQAEALDDILAALCRPQPRAVELTVPRETLVERLTGRRVCRASGHPYHVVFSPPRTPGRCDLDGSELYQRGDDTLETVTRRLEVYEAETRPVATYYAERDRLMTVVGDGKPESVASRLRDAVGAPAT